MKEILQNLANIHLINFAKENNIDVSGSHVVKNSRGFSYSLISDFSGLTILIIIFHKSSVPTFFIN